MVPNSETSVKLSAMRARIVSSYPPPRDGVSGERGRREDAVVPAKCLCNEEPLNFRWVPARPIDSATLKHIQRQALGWGIASEPFHDAFRRYLGTLQE